MKPVLLNGDSCDILKTLSDNSLDSCVTDPPYEISFMGKKWDGTGIAFDTGFWSEVYRVLKPGAYLLAFGGTRTYHRMAVAIEDAGFECRDAIFCWTYATGFPKSQGSLKPSVEPIAVFRKPLSESSVSKNVAIWGTGGINIDRCRVGTEILPALQAGQSKIGTFERGVMVTPEREGRWPTNTILVCDCEGEHNADCHVAEMDRQSGDSKSSKLNTTQKSRGCDNDLSQRAKGSERSRVRVDEGYTDSGGASRFFYVAKPSQKERGETNTHTTIKPVNLLRYLIRLATPTGGTTLDPFMGSGTAGIAATLESYSYIGIELSDEYFKISESRIAESASYAVFMKEASK